MASTVSLPSLSQHDELSRTEGRVGHLRLGGYTLTEPPSAELPTWLHGFIHRHLPQTGREGAGASVLQYDDHPLVQNDGCHVAASHLV